MKINSISLDGPQLNQFFFINTIGKFWTIYVLSSWKMIKLLKLTCSLLRSVYTLSLADRGRSVVWYEIKKG